MSTVLRKILFVTHDLSFYGASRSLQTLLRNYSGAEIDLVVRKRLIRKNNLVHLREYYGQYVQKISEFYLPIDPINTGDESNRALLLAGQMQWERNKKGFYNMVKENNYDIIHLNSLVLHQVIDNRFSFTLHVREIYDGSNQKVYESFQKAKGLIFIDEATKAAFPENQLPFHTILNNPFDMTGGQNTDPEPLRRQLGIGDKTVCSIIGTVIENKGVDFVIRAFRESKEKNIVLLIVGRADAKYLSVCKELAGGDERILFYGEEPDISKIYGISDFILRGEAYPCIGRTIYEGLYSGCNVMVPGVAHRDRDSFFDFESFQERVYFYEPRNLPALVSLLNRHGKNRVLTREYSSNITPHLKHFQDFINQALICGVSRGNQNEKSLTQGL